VSMVMWFNCMRYVGEAAFPVAELERRARTPTNLAGMHRWRYIDVEASRDDRRAKPPDRDLLVRATPRGMLAQEVWQPIARAIDTRWEDRFGSAQMDGLRAALRALVSQFELELPDCMPILHYGLASAGPTRPAFPRRSGGADDGEALALASLLSRALLMLAIDFESRSKVSLAIHADLLRVLSGTSTPVRDLPRMTGVSKEAISMGMGVIVKRGLAVLEPNANGKTGKAARLTAEGLVSQEAHARLLRKVEEQFVARYGADVTDALRESLEQLGSDPRGSRLLRGIPPFPEGWRANLPKVETLPHFPMVLHRGGYPDGS
jgi:DNA-binding MarR family transcriptional regulator